VAVDDTEDRPEDPEGGSKKFGPEDVEAGKGIRGLGCECVLAVSMDSVLEELS
jgi:hypothetical protein